MEGETFGPARWSDLDAIVNLESGSPNPWSSSAFSEELRNDPETVCVVRSSGRVVASAVTRTHFPDMDILNVTVAREHRRRGLGLFLGRSLLARAAAAGLENVFLEVRSENHAARNLYAKLGFLETQRRPRFYQDPLDDAVLLRLRIVPQIRLKASRNAC